MGQRGGDTGAYLREGAASDGSEADLNMHYGVVYGQELGCSRGFSTSAKGDVIDSWGVFDLTGLTDVVHVDSIIQYMDGAIGGDTEVWKPRKN